MAASVIGGAISRSFRILHIPSRSTADLFVMLRQLLRRFFPASESSSTLVARATIVAIVRWVQVPVRTNKARDFMLVRPVPSVSVLQIKSARADVESGISDRCRVGVSVSGTVGSSRKFAAVR